MLVIYLLSHLVLVWGWLSIFLDIQSFNSILDRVCIKIIYVKTDIWWTHDIYLSKNLGACLLSNLSQFSGCFPLSISYVYK